MKKPVVIEFEASAGSAIPTKATVEMDLVELPDFAELPDGLYQVTVVDGVATWTLSPIPALPEGNGNYQLTVVDGVYSWTEIL